MAKYAISNGIKIPEEIGAKLMELEQDAKSDLDKLKSLAESKKLSEETKGDIKDLEEKISGSIKNIHGLTSIHGKLTEIVSPATPRSIIITEPAIGIKEKVKRFPLFWKMIIISIVFLLGYIAMKLPVFEFGATVFNKAFFHKLHSFSSLI